MPNHEINPYSELPLDEIAKFIFWRSPAPLAPDVPPDIMDGIKQGKFIALTDALGKLKHLDGKDYKTIRDTRILVPIALFALFASSLATAWLRREGEQSGPANILIIVTAGLACIGSIIYLILNAGTELDLNRIERFTQKLKYDESLQLAQASERVGDDGPSQAFVNNGQIQQESQSDIGSTQIPPSEVLQDIAQKVAVLEKDNHELRNANHKLTGQLAETSASLSNAQLGVNHFMQKNSQLKAQLIEQFRELSDRIDQQAKKLHNLEHENTVLLEKSMLPASPPLKNQFGNTYNG